MLKFYKDLMKTFLKLESLPFHVFLGCFAPERTQRQCVLLDFTLSFAKPPLGCITDNLDDTICYDSLIKKLTLELEEREFHLVEHLGYTIYSCLKQNLPEGIELNLTLKKDLSVVNLVGTAIFCYGDA